MKKSLTHCREFLGDCQTLATSFDGGRSWPIDLKVNFWITFHNSLLRLKRQKNHHVHGRKGSDQDLEFHHRGPTLGKMLVRAKVFQTNRTKLILFRVRMFSSDVEKESFCPHVYKLVF